MGNENEKVLEKIGGLFFKYGIKSISMDDISRELGVSKKTLYQMFKDKRDVVEQVIKHHDGMGLKEIKRRAQDSENAMAEFLQLILMIKGFIEEINPSFEYDLDKYYPDLCKSKEKSEIENMRTFFTKNLNRGIKEGFYRTDFDVDILTKFNITTMTNIHSGGLFSMKEMLTFDIFRQYFIFMMRGVANENGLEFLNEKINDYGLN